MNLYADIHDEVIEIAHAGWLASIGVSDCLDNTAGNSLGWLFHQIIERMESLKRQDGKEDKDKRK